MRGHVICVWVSFACAYQYYLWNHFRLFFASYIIFFCGSTCQAERFTKKLFRDFLAFVFVGIGFEERRGRLLVVYR